MNRFCPGEISPRDLLIFWRCCIIFPEEVVQLEDVKLASVYSSGLKAGAAGISCAVCGKSKLPVWVVKPV